MPTLVLADVYEEDDDSEGLEPGELLINNQTIHDGQVIQHEQFRPIRYEIAPFLFLDDMREAEAQRVAQNTEFRATIRERAFLEEAPDTSFNTSEIIERLFVDEEAFEHGRSVIGNQERHYVSDNFSVPAWVIVIGIMVVTGFLIYVAVILGRRLSSVIHKNKKVEKVNG